MKIFLVRQTEITLRVLVVDMGRSGRVVGQGLFQRSMFIFIYFAFVGSLCKYSLNSVIAIFIETERVLKSHRAALTIMWHQVSIMINYTRRDNSK